MTRRVAGFLLILRYLLRYAVVTTPDRRGDTDTSLTHTSDEPSVQPPRLSLMIAPGPLFGFVLCPVWLHIAHADVVLADPRPGCQSSARDPAPLRSPRAVNLVSLCFWGDDFPYRAVSP